MAFPYSPSIRIRGHTGTRHSMCWYSVRTLAIPLFVAPPTTAACVSGIRALVEIQNRVCLGHK